MEKQIYDFVEQCRASGGTNLESIILYGSVAAKDFHQDFSDVNLLCVLRELSVEAMQALSGAISAWVRKKHPAPLLFTRVEWKRLAQVFPIELLDIQEHHRILYGEDLVSDLHVSTVLHRAQLEHELRSKLLLLRQRYVVAAQDRKTISELMLDSISSFITLFRHTLIAGGEEPPGSKREIVDRLAHKLDFDGTPFSELLDIREGKSKADGLDVQKTFSKYMAAVERVVKAVEGM